MNGKVSARQRGILRRMGRYWQLYLLILPAIAYLFLFNYIPMYGVQIAFRNFRTSKGIWGSDWVGLKHFIKFFRLPIFTSLLTNTLNITLYSLATFPIPVIFALLLNEVDNARFKKTVQMICYAPHFISTVIVCAMITIFLKDRGVITNLLAALGMPRVDYLSNPKYFASIVVWSGVWQGLGWSSIIYLAALSGVSPELVEAARIDGANRFQIVLYVNLPSILPTVVVMLILRCGSLLNLGFEKIYLLQNPLNMDASEVISTYTYNIGLLGGQYSLSSAIGLFQNVVNILMLLIVNLIAKRVSEVSLW